MCTFCKTSELPSHEKGANNQKDKFISLFLKPNKEGETYRFRLLFYRNSQKNDRKDAYIVQKIHDHWGTSQNGKKIVDDFVICPGTNYVHYDDEKFVLNTRTNKKELNCPICRKANENIAAWKNSGGSDRLSMQKFYQLKAKERLCAPVYVINDPNNEKNNGQMKVLILTNTEDIKKFNEVVKAEKSKSFLSGKEGNPYEIFNGENAVDLYIRFDTVQEVKNQGTDKESVSNVRKITHIAFGKKPSNITAINADVINNFQFDEQFYFSNTKEELEDFYKKYYGRDDVMPEEEDVFGDSSPTPQIQKVVHVESQNKNIQNETSTDDIIDELDDVVDDVNSNVDDDKPNSSIKETEEDDDLDSMMADIDNLNI